MAAGVDSSSPETDAVVLDFPVASFSSPPRIPKRLKKRLLESRSPSTAEEIEAKLRHADLRRQQFYEKLSSKARQKPRSPSRSSSNEDDLGQRLEARLQAAEQKRLNQKGLGYIYPQGLQGKSYWRRYQSAGENGKQPM